MYIGFVVKACNATCMIEIDFLMRNLMSTVP